MHGRADKCITIVWLKKLKRIPARSWGGGGGKDVREIRCKFAEYIQLTQQVKSCEKDNTVPGPLNGIYKPAKRLSASQEMS
jgi:hypothetical protein